MKKLLLFITLIGLGLHTPAQNYAWAKNIGGTSDDYGTGISTDASGNIYTIGNFSGTVDFDPGSGTYNLTAVGNYDIFISKLDAAGNFIWAKQMGGTDYNYGWTIATDLAGNVYPAGFFYGTVDFDPGSGTYNLTSGGSSDIFISKLDANGNFVWAKQIGSTGDDHCYSITTDISGNIYATGNFKYTVDFDPGAGTYNLTSAGVDDPYVCKLDGSGNFVWARHFGGILSEQSFSIKVGKSGNVYTTGRFQGTSDFDPGAGTFNLTALGGEDMYIIKLDGSGNFVWARHFGGSMAEMGYSLTLDSLDNIYTAGFFQGTVDFDPGASTFNLTSAGNFDIFVNKIDSAGNFVWVKQVGGTGNDYVYSIESDVLGNICYTGYFPGTVDFDPGASIFNLTSAGNNDIFVSKLDPLGNFISAKRVGGFDNEYGICITTDGRGNIYTTGNFRGMVDFDPSTSTYNITSTGITDAFILKLTSNSTGTISPTSCNSYVSPSSNYTWTISGTYSDTIQNTAGYDSIITINLTINTVDTLVTNTGSTLTSNANGATYRWLNCDSNNVVIAGATVQSFTPTATGNYAVEITVGSCVDTSACVNVIITGIEELTPTGIKIYPNPFDDNIVIEFGDNPSPSGRLGGASVTVVNIEGKVVYSNAAINSNKLIIDAADWSKGVYSIQILNNNETTTKKIIKQ